MLRRHDGMQKHKTQYSQHRGGTVHRGARAVHPGVAGRPGAAAGCCCPASRRNVIWDVVNQEKVKILNTKYSFY